MSDTEIIDDFDREGAPAGVPPKIAALFCRIGLVESPAELENRLLNPAYRFQLGLGMAACVVFPALLGYLVYPTVASAGERIAQVVRRPAAAEKPGHAERESVEPKAALAKAEAALSKGEDAPSNRDWVTVQEVSTASAEKPTAGEIIASPKTRLFHAEECRLRPAEWRKPDYFATAEDATAAGYSPCRRCQKDLLLADAAPAEAEATDVPVADPADANSVDRESATPTNAVSTSTEAASPAEEPAVERPANALDDGPILATLARRIFHSETCPLRPAPHRDPVYFAAPEAALESGFTPCTRCQKGLNVTSTPDASPAG